MTRTANQSIVRPTLLSEPASAELFRLHETIIRRLPVGVVIAEQERSDDPRSFRYIFANEAAGRAGGITEQKDIGHLLGERLPQLLTTDLPAAMADAVTSQRTLDLQIVTISDAAGTERLYQVAVLPLGERMVGITLEDVTEKIRAARERRAAIEELQRSNAELEQFAYVASHDLQEPLRMVTGYTGLLAKRYRGRLDADADEFIRYATEGCDRLKRLIDDLLAYSRIDRRADPEETTSAEAALKDAIAGIGPAVADAGAEIVWREGTLPRVRVARSQLAMLFQNLLSNAIKFRAPSRPPLVRVSVEAGEPDWQFSVEDNGIGIAPEFHARIFQLFQRLHGRAEYEGTGIGLALCRKIVERSGGRIWVESKSGAGAVFRFTLPAAEERR